MRTIYMVKQLNGSFLPENDSDFEIAKKIKAGDVVRFQYSKPRNYKFHKKFFALISMVYQNQDTYNNFERFRRDLTIQAGFYTEETNYFTGEVYMQEKSISFGSMDNDEFERLYNAMIDTIIEIYGWDRSDIVANVEAFM